MISFRHSVLFRLVVAYILLVVLSVGLSSAIFYVYTAGLLSRDIDNSLTAQMRRLTQLHDLNGTDALKNEIHTLLTDDKDVETEEYLFLDANNTKLAGNLSNWNASEPVNETIFESTVVRSGKTSNSLLLARRLNDGATLIVGRDMHDMHELSNIIRDAVSGGLVVALIVALIGAVVFRWQLRHQLSLIHLATVEVGEGNLRRRIDTGKGNDEFAQVGRDVNRMLDSIEKLMETSRAMTNAMAHDLRTPLGRARSNLENALKFEAPDRPLDVAAWKAIDEIDGVIVLFDKLLQIAEAEAGVCRQTFTRFGLTGVVTDLVELYEAVAGSNENELILNTKGNPIIAGDRDLIGNILANLLDNAIKYAGPGSRILVGVSATEMNARLVVEDNGAGMTQEERERAIERFYRADSRRSQPSNGLGLSIVAALVTLHEGILKIEDASPGLRILIDIPLSR